MADDAPRTRPEAIFERQLLREFGREKDLVILKNEVGLGFRGSLRGALEATLRPFGPEVVDAAMPS